MISIYVGNLPFQATEDEIRNHFSPHGEVHRVHLVTDRETGRPRGFGFVEMDDDAGRAAIEALNGQDFGGRPLTINEARPRDERQRRRTTTADDDEPRRRLRRRRRR